MKAILTVATMLLLLNEMIDSTEKVECLGHPVTKKQICCNGMLLSTNNIVKPKCCLFDVYDSQMFHCCIDKTFVKGGVKKPECCGRKLFDEAKKHCCVNNTVRIKACGQEELED